MNPADHHIVLIDDDRDMHDVIKLLLGPLGYRITCCATGADGLELVRQSLPDLLILDVMLATPTEGFEIAATIKSDPDLAYLPIIMISSAPPDSGLETHGRPGAQRAIPEFFLEKPLDGQRLRQAVASLLDRQ